MSKRFVSMQNIDDFILDYLSDIGIKSQKEIESFLFPQLSELPDPFTMDQMDEASQLLSCWVIEKKPLLIWGDYDVDGITGSSILYSFLKQLDCDVSCHIPDRVSEGYGVNKEKIKEYARKYKNRECLLITVDCGMSNRDEIRLAYEEGFKIIVTDHHEPGELVPLDCLILNGKKSGCTFGLHQLSGVGTVFFFLIALRKKLMEKQYFSVKKTPPNLKRFLALTALGTVADMMPMTQTNRILVKAGFEVLTAANNDFPGLSLLLDALDLESGVHCADEISFKIAPVINAAGRIGDPLKAFQLFTTEDVEVAERLVNELILLNEKRKEISRADYERAVSSISSVEVEHNHCVIIFGKFNQGLTGIIASRLVEAFGVAAIVFAEVKTEKQTILKGSCRSIDGVNVLKLIEYASRFTVKFGGHQGAAGVTLKKENFEAFKLMVCDAVKSNIGKISKKNKLKPYEISLDQVFTSKFLQGLSLLEPTGENVPKPEFIDTNATVVHCKQIGRDKEHLQLVFRGQAKNHRGVGFFQSNKIDIVNRGEKFTLTYTPYLNKFNKVESWQVMVSSIAQ